MFYIYFFLQGSSLKFKGRLFLAFPHWEQLSAPGSFVNSAPGEAGYSPPTKAKLLLSIRAPKNTPKSSAHCLRTIHAHLKPTKQNGTSGKRNPICKRRGKSHFCSSALQTR